MSDCQHHFGIGVIEVNGECIVSVACGNCDLLVTGAGVVSDLGGGYTVIDSRETPGWDALLGDDR